MLTGLRREARILAGPGVETCCSGGDGARLRQALAMETRHFDIIVSFGLAGGLDPALSPATLVIADAVIGEMGQTPTSRAASQKCVESLAAAGLAGARANVVGVDRPAIDAITKRELRTRTHAGIVDTESHVAAAFARRMGAGLLVVRAVADPAESSLPRLALDALDAQGRIRLGKVARGLVARPADLLPLLAAGRNSARAFASLGRCRILAGLLLGLGLADLG